MSMSASKRNIYRELFKYEELSDNELNELNEHYNTVAQSAKMYAGYWDQQVSLLRRYRNMGLSYLPKNEISEAED